MTERLSDEEIARIRVYWRQAPTRTRVEARAEQDITALLTEIVRLRRIDAAARAVADGFRHDWCPYNWQRAKCDCGMSALRAALDGDGGERG